MDWTTPLVSVAVGTLSAYVSARLTLHYALKRFYSEKWWEKKLSAYSGIIEGLHHLKKYADVHMEHDMRGTEPPDERKAELARGFQRAHDELRMQIDVGTFLLSPAAVTVLRQLDKVLADAKNTTSWVQHLMLEYNAVTDCLEKMREIARNDLGVG